MTTNSAADRSRARSQSTQVPGYGDAPERSRTRSAPDSGTGTEPAPAGDRGLAATGHVVQLYDQDSELVERVTGYLLGAVEEGDVAIVVATPAHRRAVQARLADAGVDVSAAVEDGTFRFLDADQIMRRFLVDDWPDPGGFESVIGG